MQAIQAYFPTSGKYRFILLALSLALLLSGTQGARKVPLGDLKLAYQTLLDAQSFCRHKRAVIISDKPVYKAGETAFFAVYYFNLLTKQPLLNCQNNVYNSVTIYDVNDKYITSLQSEVQSKNPNVEDAAIADHSAFYYAYEIPKDAVGGVFAAKISGGGGDEARFFVMAFANRQVAVVGDWSNDFVSPGEILKGKLTLRLLTAGAAKLGAAFLSYKWLDSAARELFAAKDASADGSFQLNFLAPPFGETLTFFAEVTAGEYTAVYKKDFLKPRDEELVVDFAVASGKLVKDMANKVYFQAFLNANRTEPVPVRAAKVTKTVKGHTTVQVPSLASDELGKGLFELSVFHSDVANNATFEFEVTGEQKSLKFKIFDLAKLEFSPVLLRTKSLFYNSEDTMNIELSTFDFRGSLNAVVLNKGQILAQRLTAFAADRKPSPLKKDKGLLIDLSELNVREGGVFTIQLYAGKQDKAPDTSDPFGEMAKLEQAFNSPDAKIEADAKVEGGAKIEADAKVAVDAKIVRPRPRPIPPVYTPPRQVEYEGRILQEIDVFIEPRYIVCSEINLNKASYLPGEKVEFSVTPTKKNARCLRGSLANISALVIATDESAFLEVEKSRESSSLFAKLFLEREVLPSSKALKYAHKYIDPLFDCKRALKVDEFNKLARNVEFLLGNSAARRFLFDPANLEKYIQQPYDAAFNDSRLLFEYLVPTESSGFVQPVYFAENVMFKRAAAPVFAKAVNVDMNLEAAAVPMADFGGAQPAANGTLPVPSPDVAPGPLSAAEEAVLKHDTIYHEFKSLEKGAIVGQFKLPDRVTNFSLRVILFTPAGVYGFNQKSLQVRKPVNIVADSPLFMYKDEEFKIPVLIENNQARQIEVVFQKPAKLTRTVKANSAVTEVFSLTKDNVPLLVELADAGGQTLATYKFDPQLVNPGILAVDGLSGYISAGGARPQSLVFARPFNRDLIAGNNRLEVCYRNGALEIILEAIKEFNRIPTGCFEQASTTTFPIIVALKLLKRLPASPELQKLIFELTDNLKKGIKLLLTYECKSGGFEWFGADPGHSTLTAYGLWQFYEIAQLDPSLFSPELIARLQAFLQSQKDKTGGFFIRQGLDALGNPEKLVSDIYVLFVLSKSFPDLKTVFGLEYEYLLGVYKEFKASKRTLDSYKLAVIGLMFLNTGDKELAAEVMGVLATRQNSKGRIEQAETSITRSSGDSLAVEIASLTMLLGLGLPGGAFKETVDKCLTFISESLKKVYYQSTQATILSLLAIDAYLATYSSSDTGNVAFKVSLGNQAVGSIDVGAEKALQKNVCVYLNAELLALEAKEEDLRLTVESPATEGPGSGRFFFEVKYEYYSGLPNSAPNSPLDASVTRKTQGEVSTYTLTLKNLRPAEQGMAIVEFNRPSCADFNINDLEAMRQKGEFAYYELKENNRTLVFYFRGLKPNETRTLALSLVRRFGQTTCPERAHLVYLYYDKEGSILYRKAN